MRVDSGAPGQFQPTLSSRSGIGTGALSFFLALSMPSISSMPLSLALAVMVCRVAASQECSETSMTNGESALQLAAESDVINTDEEVHKVDDDVEFCLRAIRRVDVDAQEMKTAFINYCTSVGFDDSLCDQTAGNVLVHCKSIAMFCWSAGGSLTIGRSTTRGSAFACAKASRHRSRYTS